MRKDKLHWDFSTFNFIVTYLVFAQYHFLLLVRNGVHNKLNLMGKWHNFIKPKPADTVNFQVLLWKTFLTFAFIPFLTSCLLFLEEVNYFILISNLRRDMTTTVTLFLENIFVHVFCSIWNYKHKYTLYLETYFWR